MSGSCLDIADDAKTIEKEKEMDAANEVQPNTEQKPQKKLRRQHKKLQHKNASKAKTCRKLKQPSRKRSKSERLQPTGDLAEDFVKKQRQRLQHNFKAPEPLENQLQSSPREVSKISLLESDSKSMYM